MTVRSQKTSKEKEVMLSRNLQAYGQKQINFVQEREHLWKHPVTDYKGNGFSLHHKIVSSYFALPSPPSPIFYHILYE